MPLDTSSPCTTLVVACLATAMLMFDVAVVNTAVAQIGRDLRVGPGSLKWIVDGYALPMASTGITLGALADRCGRRLVFRGGLCVFTLASLGCALAPDVNALVATRVAQGLGGSLLFASSLALVAGVYRSPAGRANAMAAYGAAIGTSFAVGPLMGGALADGPGWRWIFLINVPIGLLAIVVTVRRVRESRDPDPRRTDLPGLGTLAAGLFLLVFALLRGRGDGWSSTRTVAELGGAAALILAFLIIEARSAAPVLPLGLLRIRRFAAAQIGTLALSASFFALYLYVTVLLQDMLGVAPLGTGLVYLAGTLLIFIFSGASAQLGAGAHSSWTMVEPGFLLASLGTGLRNPVLAALSLASVAATMSALPPVSPTPPDTRGSRSVSPVSARLFLATRSLTTASRSSRVSARPPGSQRPWRSSEPSRPLA